MNKIFFLINSYFFDSYIFKIKIFLYLFIEIIFNKKIQLF